MMLGPHIPVVMAHSVQFKTNKKGPTGPFQPRETGLTFG